MIAFYLPQFYPTAENDEFWGPGFTEWTNVAAARPLFRGHRQPLLPGDLGFYDLRLAEVRAAQAELAVAHGVTAFCYWHYYFAGRQLLDLVVREIVQRGEPQFPFCLGWANQSWTGVWHGSPDRVLVEQTYPGPDDHRRHFDDLVDVLDDPRYLRVDGRPVFYVTDPRAIPDVEDWVTQWRGLAESAGLGGLFLVGEYRGGLWLPQHHGFDGSVALRFPDTKRRRLSRRGRPTVVPYAKSCAGLTSLEADEHFPCVVPRWDHTPRSGRQGLVLEGSTPDLFRRHVESAVAKAQLQGPGRRLLWIKSWNEWAEGNTLEPDREFGHGYLEALRDSLTSAMATSSRPAHTGDWWRGNSRHRPVVYELARRWTQRAGMLETRSSPSRAVPVVLCIDCEPDSVLVDGGDLPSSQGYELAQEFLVRWRDKAADVTGAPVHLNWFFRMDAEIARTYGRTSALVDRYPQFVEAIQGAGDGLGVRPYARHWDPSTGTWVADFVDDLSREVLTTSVASFQAAFGRSPELLRYGDTFLTNGIVDTAEEAGIRYDLTLVPGRAGGLDSEGGTRTAGSSVPDYRRVPRHPYFPSYDDYRRPLTGGQRGMRLVPLTSGARWLGRSARARLAAIRAYGYRNWKQRDVLDMALSDWTGPNSFGEMLNRTLAAQGASYLAFAIRTDWARHPHHRRNVERCLEEVLRQQQRYRLRFCRPDEACIMIESRGPIGAVIGPSDGSSSVDRRAAMDSHG